MKRVRERATKSGRAAKSTEAMKRDGTLEILFDDKKIQRKP